MGFSQATWFDTSIRALFIYHYYYYYYYNYYWPNIASKKEKPLFNSWSQNYFFFLANKINQNLQLENGHQKRNIIWNLYEIIGLLSCSCAGYYVRRLTVLSLHVTHTVPLCRHPCPIPQLVTTRKTDLSILTIWPIYSRVVSLCFSSMNLI